MTLREASFNFNSEATQKRSIGKEQLETRSKPSIQLTGEAANSSANNDEFTVGPPRRVSDVHTNIGRFSCDFLLFAIKLTVSLFDVILQTHTSCRNVQAGKFSTGETSSKARNVGNIDAVDQVRFSPPSAEGSVCAGVVASGEPKIMS